MSAETLARVIRGETIESVHAGHLIVMDGERNTIVSIGEPSTVTFFRSAAKAFQMIPCITSRAADAFGFDEQEIALAVASHSGEEMHVTIAARMLEKAGISESDLRCGAHLPFSSRTSQAMLRAGEEPTQRHNNCSGKHAAMLAFAKHIGADIATYDLPEHPIQREILRTVAEFCEVKESDIELGIDGCAAPNFALPLRAMAFGFLNLIAPGRFRADVQTACSRIVQAMMVHPDLIGGSDRLDTMIMKAARGRLISKVGADGVWLCGILPCDEFPSGAAIALKIADGDDHKARPVVSVEVLRQLGILSNADLADVSPMPVKNRRGDTVGFIRHAWSELR